MLNKTAVPIYSIKITPAEMEQARVTRAALKNVLLSLDATTDVLERFAVIISEIKDLTDLNSLRLDIVELRHDIQAGLNDFLHLVEQSLTAWGSMISDSNFDAMRKAYTEEIRKIRETAIEMLESLRDLSNVKILQDIPEQITNIVACKNAIDDMISVQLFQKIDRDVLGRIRIGSKLNK